jgi:hypothetical protein
VIKTVSTEESRDRTRYNIRQDIEGTVKWEH